MKYKKTSLLAIAVALALTLCMATGFTTGATAADNGSVLPSGQTQTSGPQDSNSTLGGLGSVNRGDEHKFTPEEWAEILKKVEAGEILFFETAEEERAFWENEDNAALKESLLSKGSIDMKTFNVATDNGKEIPINELDLTTGDVGTEIDGI